MEEFKKKYIEEACEIIATLEDAILKLEANAGEMEVVEEVFRSMHTLKGGAAMFGFDNIRDVTHELENAYDQIRSGKNTVTKPLLDITLEGIDYFKHLLEDTSQSNDTAYHEQLIERITNVLEGKTEDARQAPSHQEKPAPEPKQEQTEEPAKEETPPEPTVSQDSNEAKQEPPAPGENDATPEETTHEQDEHDQDIQKTQDTPDIQTYHIYFQPNKDILKNGTNPLLLLEELVSLGEAEVYPVTASVPPIDQLNVEELHISWNVLLAADPSKEEEIRDVFMFVEDDSILHINVLGSGNLLQDEFIAGHIKGMLSADPEVSYDDLQNLLVNGKTGRHETPADEKTEEEPQQEKEAPVQDKEVFFEDQAEAEETEGAIETEKYQAAAEEKEAENDTESSTREDSREEIKTQQEVLEEVKAATKEEAEKEAVEVKPETTSGDHAVAEPPQKSKASNGAQKRNTISSIRISAEKVDELMNLVSELVTTQARLNLYTEKQSNTELEEINENIHKLTSQLRDNAFDLSLIPMQSIVTRFQRLVRDLSSSLGKEVNFVTEGTDTELDKSIIENLVDPILHILRNSIDHGIEDAPARKKSGKPARGTILLKAYYSGANVHIEISDDGKGLDIDAIHQKGIEIGLVSPQAKLSKKQIFDLVFAPGFSTSQSVTDVSGRGVGMDVVKEKISGIRGEVDIDSQLNKGTTVTIKLPLTLSIIDGLLVDISDTKYIVPLNVVDKIYAIKHTDLDKSFYNIIELNQQQFPYYYLRREFGFNETPPVNEQVVVVSYEDKQIGIVVDRVIGEYQAVLKPLGKHYRKIQIISGATILGDGSVALVMDTNKIIGNFSAQQAQQQSYINQQLA